MNYIEVHINCNAELNEILIAELDFINAESISETKVGLLVSFLEDDFNSESISDLSSQYGFSYTSNKAENKNWNEEWEKNFDPLIVKNCSIRASFHQKPENVDYDIIINPKMSFGTGHHETTSLIVEKMLGMDFQKKTVLDMGTGTGILAILAEMKGAKDIVAIDIDDWSVENSIENIEINNCSEIEIFKGDAEKLQDFGNFEVVIANINRNILLNDMANYVNHLSKDGKLLLSGFYSEDIPLLNDKATSLGLELTDKMVKNNWSMLEFRNAN